MPVFSGEKCVLITFPRVAVYLVGGGDSLLLVSSGQSYPCASVVSYSVL